MRHGNIFPTDRSLPSMRARFNGHALKGQKFIAQGKRSDTLGKPPHHITLRPVRAKVNITRSVSALLPLQGATCTATLYPGRRFACRWAMNFCPFRACPLNAPHRKTDTSTLWGVPVLTSSHTTLRLRKICHLPRQRRDLWKPITPNGICKSAFYI